MSQKRLFDFKRKIIKIVTFLAVAIILYKLLFLINNQILSSKLTFQWFNESADFLRNSEGSWVWSKEGGFFLSKNNPYFFNKDGKFIFDEYSMMFAFLHYFLLGTLGYSFWDVLDRKMLKTAQNRKN